MRPAPACLLVLAGCVAGGPPADEASRPPRVDERPVDFTLLERDAEFGAVRAVLTRVEGLGPEDQLDELVVRSVAAKPGQIVADVGCGGGRHALHIAHQVGASGRVYCRDIAAGLIDRIVELARLQGLEQVDARVSRPEDACLPEAAVDVILLSDVYGMVLYGQPETKDAFLRSLHDALRPGGLVVVGFIRSVRTRRDEATERTTADFIAAGFEPGRRLLFEDLPDRPLILDFWRP